MEKNPYIVDLHGLSSGNNELTFALDDAFFAMEEGDILGGNVIGKVVITNDNGRYTLAMHAEGEVRVTCDRCLDAVPLALIAEEKLQVKIGEGEDDEETIWVREDNEKVDLGWLLYEMIVINLPMIHCHRDGECNSQMQELLQTHICQMEDPEE